MKNRDYKQDFMQFGAESVRTFDNEDSSEKEIKLIKFRTAGDPQCDKEECVKERKILENCQKVEKGNEGRIKEIQDKCENEKEEIKQENEGRIKEIQDKCENEKEEVKQELRDCKDEKEEVKQELRGCKDEKEEVKQELRDCKDEKEEVKQELRDCKDEKEEVKQELRGCKDGKKQIKEEYEGRVKEIQDECQDEKEKIKEEYEGRIKEIQDKYQDEKNKIEDYEDKIEKSAVITSQEITLDHCMQKKCGYYANSYKTDNYVGLQGFSTSDLLKALHPEMYSNPKIAEHLQKGAYTLYKVENYKFVFTQPIMHSWGSFSNMKCDKCQDNPNNVACQDDKIKTFCYPDYYYASKEYMENFLDRNSCPNLIKQTSAMTGQAKQVVPLILIDNLGRMIDKEGNSTKVYYSYLKPHLKANGNMKDCTGNAVCKEFAEIMKKVAWYSDKEVVLKTVYDNIQNTSPYHYGNNNNDPKMFSAPSQDTLPDDDAPEVLNNLRMPYYPEPTPGEQVLIELKRLGATADINIGSIRGTEMHFETCSKKLVEEVNKGNIALLGCRLIANCDGDQSCEECVEAFNFAIGNNTNQCENEIPEIYGDLGSNAYDNAII